MGEWNRRRFISSGSHRGRQRPCRVERLRLTWSARAGAASGRARRDPEPRRGQRRGSAAGDGEASRAEAHVRAARQRRGISPRRQPGDEADRPARGYRRRPRARHVHREHRRHHAAARAPEQPCGRARHAGEIELEVGGDRWTMMRGDFANLPPGTAHGWTMKSDGAQLALFSMNHRVGSAFTAMGERQDGAQIPSNVPHEIPAAALARAAAAGDFQLAPAAHAGGRGSPGHQQAAAGHAGRLRAGRRRRRAVRRQHVPRTQCEYERPVPVHHHGRRPGRGSRRAFSRAAFRELLRARW